MFHRMAHKVLFASFGAGDYSSASIVVPFFCSYHAQEKSERHSCRWDVGCGLLHLLHSPLFASRHGEEASC